MVGEVARVGVQQPERAELFCRFIQDGLRFQAGRGHLSRECIPINSAVPSDVLLRRDGFRRFCLSEKWVVCDKCNY